jgi:hypothetical protein
LTFKSVPGRGKASYEQIVSMYAEQLGQWCSRWQLIHLLSNRDRERTFIGVVR